MRKISECGYLVAALLVASALNASSTPTVPEDIPREHEARIRAAVPARPQVPPRKERRVLIWSTPEHLADGDPHKGYSVPYGIAAFRLLGEATGAYVPVVSGDVSVFLPEKIRSFDAIVLNNACGQWIRPSEAAFEKMKAYGETIDAVEAALRKSLLDYVSAGGGIFACHYAIGGNPQWPEFQALIGAKFTGHPWNEEVCVALEEPESPLLAAFGGKRFRIADEIYEFGPPYDRTKLRVLLSLDTSRTNMGVPWIGREDGDFAQAWVKRYGKGRVFYAGFGHRTEIWWNPMVLRFFLDGIQFAAGDLEAPADPRSPDDEAARLAADPDRRRRPGPTPPEVRLERMRAGSVPAPSEEDLRKIEAACPDSPLIAPEKRRAVLVWGHTWTHTPNAFAERAIEILGKKTRAFEVHVSDDPRLLLPDRIGRFDAIVWNNIHEPEPFLPPDFGKLDSEQQAAARAFDRAVKASVLEYARRGGGIVGIHAATAALQGWPEYGELMGGYYGGHIEAEVAIKIEESEHPVATGFGGKSFRIRDEVYIFREPYSRKSLRVLASLDLSSMPDPGGREDKDYAVSWVRTYGEGRVFYTTLGHALETYSNPLFLRHLLAGIQFATGDLRAEASPRAR